MDGVGRVKDGLGSSSISLNGIRYYHGNRKNMNKN